MKIEIDLPQNLPYFNISNNEELLLFLLNKELHTTKLVTELDKSGLGTAIFSSDLGTLILLIAGFKSITDEVNDWYCKTLYQLSQQVDLTDDSLTENLAKEFYEALLSKPECANLVA